MGALNIYFMFSLT